jgi:hypothetical protein
MLSKIYNYRIILTKNGKYKSTLYRGKDRKHLFINFNKIKKENSKVIFPKIFVNSGKIKEVEYKIYAVKNYEPNDEIRYVRNNLGKLIKEDLMFNIWTVLANSEYNIEEYFWIYGKDKIKERCTIHYIIDLIKNNKPTYNNNLQIIVVNNKLLIHNENTFEMVICKCIEECQKLHHKLYDIIINQKKLRNITFMGTANKIVRVKLYDIIHKKTNWSYKQIWRTKTKH